MRNDVSLPIKAGGVPRPLILDFWRMALGGLAVGLLLVGGSAGASKLTSSKWGVTEYVATKDMNRNRILGGRADQDHLKRERVHELRKTGEGKLQDTGVLIRPYQLVRFEDLVEFAQKHQMVLGDTATAERSLRENDSLRDSVLVAFEKSKVPDQAKQGRSRLSSVELTKETDGVVVDSKDIRAVLEIFAGLRETPPLFHTDTSLPLALDMAKSQPLFTLYQARNKTGRVAEESKKIVDEIMTKVDKQGRFHKWFEYEGDFTAFYNRTIDVDKLNDKQSLIDISASELTKNDLARNLGLLQRLSKISIAGEIEPIATARHWFTIDLKSILGLNETPSVVKTSAHMAEVATSLASNEEHTLELVHQNEPYTADAHLYWGFDLDLIGHSDGLISADLRNRDYFSLHQPKLQIDLRFANTDKNAIPTSSQVEKINSLANVIKRQMDGLAIAKERQQ